MTLYKQLEKLASGRDYRAALVCVGISASSFLLAFFIDMGVARKLFLGVAFFHFSAAMIFAVMFAGTFVKTVLTYGYPKSQEKDGTDGA